jgi:hypothetical protein
MQQAKMDALQKISTPVDVLKLRAFLGFANYYHPFVKRFNLIAKPLTNVTKKDQPWIWDCE